MKIEELIPLDNRAVVRVPKIEAVTAGGILLTDETVEKQSMAHLVADVLRVADGFFPEEAHRPAVGDQVLIAKYAGLLYEIDDQDIRIVAENDVVALRKGNGK